MARLLEGLRHRRPSERHVSTYPFAVLVAALGDTRAAFPALEPAISGRSTAVRYVALDDSTIAGLNRRLRQSR